MVRDLPGTFVDDREGPVGEALVFRECHR
jgi:hypothetical protein